MPKFTRAVYIAVAKKKISLLEAKKVFTDFDREDYNRIKKEVRPLKYKGPKSRYRKIDSSYKLESSPLYKESTMKPSRIHGESGKYKPMKVNTYRISPSGEKTWHSSSLSLNPNKPVRQKGCRAVGFNDSKSHN